MSFWKRARRELRVRALLVGLPLLKVLPLGAAAVLGSLAWRLARGQRKLALEHLAIAFPEMPLAERKRIGRGNFQHLARAAMETARAGKLDIKSQVLLAPEDEALLRKLHAEGKGVVLASCHVGNWELFARRIAALGLPSATVAREAQDPRLTKLLDDARTSAGVRVFWRGSASATRGLLRFLKAGGMLGVLIDQDTKVAGHFVPFFGRPAFTPRAAADLSVRFHAPMVFGCAHRLASGVHQIVLRRIEQTPTGDRDLDSKELTAAATRAIEEEVRKTPEQWVWMHPRWRTSA